MADPLTTTYSDALMNKIAEGVPLLQVFHMYSSGDEASFFEYFNVKRKLRRNKFFFLMTQLSVFAEGEEALKYLINLKLKDIYTLCKFLVSSVCYLMFYLIYYRKKYVT